MAYDGILKLLDNDTKLKSFMTNMINGRMQIPYIMDNTLDILDDENPVYRTISDTNKIALCRMIDLYFNDCYMEYIKDRPLDKLLEYGKIEIYKIDARDGLRYATINEVAQGVVGLIPENLYPAGQEEYEYMCLLQWSFTGISYFLRQAGYKLKYDENGKVSNTFYELIQMTAVKLNEMFKWMSIRSQYEKALKTLKKWQGDKGYKYITFAKDEITDDISIKQLLYEVKTKFPRSSDDVDFRKSIALALKADKTNKYNRGINGVNLTPLEVSFLREQYNKFITSDSRKDTIKEIKDDCDYLMNKRYSGLINPNHFAYNIIKTLEKINYSKCSVKQYDILRIAINTIKEAEEKKFEEDKKNNNASDNEMNNNETKVISDMDIESSLLSISNAIGNGLFEN